MDERTRRYREDQLERIAGGQDYLGKMKMSSIGGETNWLNVTDEEVEAIKQVMTGIKEENAIRDELLEACKAISKACGNKYGWPDIHLGKSKLSDIIDNAIAKAEA